MRGSGAGVVYQQKAGYRGEVMIIITAMLLVTVGILSVLLWQRIKRERQLAKSLFKLNDIERKYIGIAMKQGRIDAKQRQAEDEVFIQSLIAQGWFYALTDNSLITDSKTEYLEALLAKG